MMTKADEGGRGVIQMLTIADEGGGVYEPLTTQAFLGLMQLKVLPGGE